MVLMGFYTCRENTECFISVKKKNNGTAKILAILVRVAAGHLNKKNAEDFCIQSRRKAFKYDRKRFGVG